jgi:hypothetical protein
LSIDIDQTVEPIRTEKSQQRKENTDIIGTSNTQTNIVAWHLCSNSSSRRSSANVNLCALLYSSDPFAIARVVFFLSFIDVQVVQV